MAQYELIVVYAEQTTQEQIDKSTAAIRSEVEKTGGTVQLTPWGKRELAYEIERNRYGHYVQIDIAAETSVPRKLESKLRIEDAVLRYLTVRVN